jgi:hypothetical protein
MQFFIRPDGFIHLLFANIAPWTNGITNDLNVEIRHLAQGLSEHKFERDRGKPQLKRR